MRTRFGDRLTSLVALSLAACGGSVATDDGTNRSAPYPGDDLAEGGAGGGVVTDYTREPVDTGEGKPSGAGGAGGGPGVAGAAGASVTAIGGATMVVFDPEPPPPPPSPVACAEDGTTSDVEGLSLPVEVDYLASRRFDDAGAQITVEERGVPCATALNPTVCQAALATAPPFPFIDGERWLVWTRGDEVGVVTGTAELTQLLGAIDTPNEAILVLRAVQPGTLHDSCQVSLGTAGPPYCMTREYAISAAADNCQMETYSIETTCVESSGAVNTSRRLEERQGMCMGGRRPRGFTPLGSNRTGDPRGAYFAELCALETASIAAFVSLAEQLRRLGAPDALVTRCHEAARDEIHHAALTTEAARRFGSAPDAAPIAPSCPPDLFTLALENAEEGCVRETYGAASAHFASARAREPWLRRLWRVIAVDETRHAELSRDIGDWLDTRLSDDERARVAEHRTRAFDTLRDQMSPLDIGAERALGLPSGLSAANLLDTLRPLLVA